MCVTFTLIDYIKEIIKTDSLIFFINFVLFQGDMRHHKQAAILVMNDKMPYVGAWVGIHLIGMVDVQLANMTLVHWTLNFKGTPMVTTMVDYTWCCACW